MKIFDENLREIFIYRLSEGDCECYAEILYYTYENIPEEKIQSVIAEYDALKEKCKQIAAEIEAKYPKDYAQRHKMYSEMSVNIPGYHFLDRYNGYNIFLIEKLGLTKFETENEVEL